MNILDLKRKSLGWHACGGDSDSGSSSSNDSYGGMDTSYGGMDASGFGPTGDYGGDTSYGGGGDSYSGFSQAEMDAAAQQSDAQATENEAVNSDSGWGGTSFSDLAAQEANRLAAQLDAANPNKTAVNTMDALMGVSAGFGTMSVDARGINPGFEGGWSLGVADRMNDLGYGDREGLNANNATQNIAGIVGSTTMNDKVMPAVAGLVTSMVPYGGLAMAGMRAAGSVTSGQKSLGDAVKDFAIDYGASKLAGMVNSKIGSAIGPENMANLGLIGSVSKAFGGPSMPNIGASVVNSAMNVAGISKSTGSGFTSQNNPAADHGFTAPGTNYGGGDGGGTSGINTPSVTSPTTPTVQGAMDTNVNINLWGSMDGEGWRAAKEKYGNNKRARS